MKTKNVEKHTKFWPWMKKHWILVVNPIVIFVAYANVFEKGFTGIEILLALTFLVNASYLGYTLFSGKTE